MNPPKDHDYLEETRQLRQYVNWNPAEGIHVAKERHEHLRKHKKGKVQPAQTPCEKEAPAIQLAEMSEYEEQNEPENPLSDEHIGGWRKRFVEQVQGKVIIPN